MWRRILARELKTIAEGRTPKKWQRPSADVLPIVDVNLRGGGGSHP
jgi:hypothetical protein